jgi:hypothetical protein
VRVAADLHHFETGGPPLSDPRAHVAEVIGGPADVSASFALAASDNVCHVIIDSAHQFRIGVLGSFQFGNESLDFVPLKPAELLLSAIFP